MTRSRTVYQTCSALSGRIRVIDHGSERRLVVVGDTLSVYPLDGDWARVQSEYWWHALAMAAMPPHPTALLVGLGGGTQVHLLRTLARPRRITVIERDPTILRLAQRWFGLDRVPGIDYLCGDAEVVVPWLGRTRRRFDFVMEDAAYADAPERALPLALALAPLVSPRGALVLNRHRRSDAGRLVEVLRRHFREVRQRSVRREAENVLIACARPLTTTTSGRSARVAGQPRGRRFSLRRCGRSASAPSRLWRSAS